MRNRKPTISLDCVPEDCLSKVIKLTPPRDASRFAAVCGAFRSMADSDDMWEHFLPSDLPSILSRADEMGDHLMLLKRKELYLCLCRNWISLDGGLKRFGLDLPSGAKKLFLPKEQLSIIDTRQSARPPQLWIVGTVDCNDLSPGTNYTAYLIFTTAATTTYSHHDMQNNQQQSRLEFLNDLARAIEPMSKACLILKISELSFRLPEWNWAVLGPLQAQLSFGFGGQLSFNCFIQLQPNLDVWIM